MLCRWQMASLATEVATVFKGATLRGLLLNAYAFVTMGTIVGMAPLVALVGAGALFRLFQGSPENTPGKWERRGTVAGGRSPGGSR